VRLHGDHEPGPDRQGPQTLEEVSGNVALMCRYHRISRQAYYIWYRRYQTEGIEGLRTRSKRPKTSPPHHQTQQMPCMKGILVVRSVLKRQPVLRAHPYYSALLNR
jgi:hypothetical protein